MEFKPLEEQYYFVSEDIRRETEDYHLEFPWVQEHDSFNDDQDLNWYNNEPVQPYKDVAFQVSDGHIETPEAFANTDMIFDPNVMVMKKHARNLIMHLIASSPTQWLPSYITTSKGEVYEDWFTLHAWKEWDCWDRERSKFYGSGGKIYNDELSKIYLDEQAIFHVPEEERLIIRLNALGDDYLLFHEKIVNVLLDNKMKGALFVPLKFFGPGGRWWYENSEAINKLHPW